MSVPSGRQSRSGPKGTLTGQPPVAKRLNVRLIVKSAILLGFIFLIVIPSVPSVMGPGLDASWVLGLNMAHFDRMIFGRDIVFTYGPLGYLAFPTFPEAEPWVVFASVWGIALLTAYALWKLCRHSHWTAACLYLGVFWICGAFSYDVVTERMLTAIIALALLIAARLDAEPWFDLGILFFLAAVALLTKFNIGVIGLLVALYLEAYLLWRQRSTARRVLKPAAATLAVWPITFVGLYWILDGTPSGLAAFLRHSVEMAGGYSDAMAVGGPMWVAAPATLSCMVLWFCLPLAAGDIRRLIWAVPPIVAIGFLCFKAAMVRQDHALPFPFEIAMTALLIVALASTPRSRIAVGVFALASIAFGITTVTELWPQLLPTDLDHLTGRAPFRNLNAFWHWRTTVGTLEAATKQALVADQLPPEFPPYVSGKRVSAYPWDIALIRANHLHWQPLPVIQTYASFTPALDLFNAKKLDDAAGPEEILLSWSAIDGRHPFYETPGSWRALLNWYDLQLKSPELYVVHRRLAPRFGPAIPIGTVVARLGQKITLPPVAGDEALVMDAEIKESLEGTFKRTMLRSTAIRVHATLRSGFTDAARVVRTNMRDGVIVSDWPIDLDDLAPMLEGGGNFSPDRVASIYFETLAPSEFNPAIRIQWSRVKLRQPAPPEQPPPAPFLHLTELWTPKDPLPVVLNAEVRREQGYIAVRSLNIDPQCMFAIGPQLGNYKTIMIRAKYQVNDRVDIFFGRQIDGRGLPGFVHFSQQWIDAYFHVGANPYWSQEHGTVLRFDPVSERGVHSIVKIAGIWGSPDSLPSSERVYFAAPTPLVKAALLPQ